MDILEGGNKRRDIPGSSGCCLLSLSFSGTISASLSSSLPSGFSHSVSHTVSGGISERDSRVTKGDRPYFSVSRSLGPKQCKECHTVAEAGCFPSAPLLLHRNPSDSHTGDAATHTRVEGTRERERESGTLSQGFEWERVATHGACVMPSKSSLKGRIALFCDH